MNAAGVTVRSADRGDTDAIRAMIESCALDGALLRRHRDDIEPAIPGFVVGERSCDRGTRTILGCAALVACGASLAEVRSVAVAPAARGTGLGRSMIERLVDTAAALGMDRLFLLTKVPGFFERLGFRDVDPASLPDSFLHDLVLAQQRTYLAKHVMTRPVLRGLPQAPSVESAASAGPTGAAVTGAAADTRQLLRT